MGEISRQTASSVLMVSPVRFSCNMQAAQTNDFMKASNAEEDSAVQRDAKKEFDFMITRLEECGVKVLVIEDTLEPHKPDSIFPNNWISTHSDGRIFLYPMCPTTRRSERREDIVQLLLSEHSFLKVEDLSYLEQESVFLEGTGSLVLDRANNIAYANISARTDPKALLLFAQKSNFQIVSFTAFRSTGTEIYHTNVMLSIGETTAVVCPSVVRCQHKRRVLLESLQAHRKVMEISEDQLNMFAGNMLQLRSAKGLLWVLSQSARDSLSPVQMAVLSAYSAVLAIPLPTVEFHGGGSARCMMAELFPPA